MSETTTVTERSTSRSSAVRRTGPLAHHSIEVFEIVDEWRPYRPALPRQETMKGSSFKALYYILATIIFLLYGAFL